MKREKEEREAQREVEVERKAAWGAVKGAALVALAQQNLFMLPAEEEVTILAMDYKPPLLHLFPLFLVVIFEILTEKRFFFTTGKLNFCTHLPILSNFSSLKSFLCILQSEKKLSRFIVFFFLQVLNNPLKDDKRGKLPSFCLDDLAKSHGYRDVDVKRLFKRFDQFRKHCLVEEILGALKNDLRM